MNSPSGPGDLSLTSVLDLIRYRLAVLIDAIITNRPLRCAMRSCAVLDSASAATVAADGVMSSG